MCLTAAGWALARPLPLKKHPKKNKKNTKNQQNTKHMLPNFNECWWDSWLLDVLLCNFGGIVAGMATVRLLDASYAHYDWQGLSELPTLRAKARRSAAQLLPYSWERFNWALFSSEQLLVLLLFCVLLCCVVFCCVGVFFCAPARSHQQAHTQCPSNEKK